MQEPAETDGHPDQPTAREPVTHVPGMFLIARGTIPDLRILYSDVTRRQSSPTRRLATFFEGAVPGGVPEYRSAQIRSMREGPMQSFVDTLTILRSGLAEMGAVPDAQYADLRALCESAWADYLEWEKLNRLVSSPENRTLPPWLLVAGTPDERWAMKKMDWDDIETMTQAQREEELVIHGERLIEEYVRALLYWIQRLPMR